MGRDGRMEKPDSILQNRVAKIDLTTGTVTEENPGEAFYRKYLGGRGLSLHYMLDGTRPGTDPLSAGNIVVFSAGLLNGINAPGTSKYSVTSKSPLTGGIAESEAGGFWGAYLRHCGFDALVVQGISPEPVYLAVEDRKISIHDAKPWWEAETKLFQTDMREKYGESKVLQIGPAGARGVLFANIMNDLRFFNGRNGLGAVMGSKRLKGIVLRPSSRNLAYFDRKLVMSIFKDVTATAKVDPISRKLHELGTAAGLSAVNAMGILPTRNWRTGVFEGISHISGEALAEKYVTGRHGCFACTIACKPEVRFVDENFEVDGAYGGPEYESIAALGSMCGISDLAAICKANELCNRYGMDTISAGSTIAFAMDCVERELVKESDIGYSLRFGDASGMLRMVRDIAFREGFGEVLAQGSYRAAIRVGGVAFELCQHAKKQELPMHDPRARRGFAIQYAFSPRGADHWVAQHDQFFAKEDSPGLTTLKEIGIHQTVLPSRNRRQRKVEHFHVTQQLCSAYDSLGICTAGCGSARDSDPGPDHVDDRRIDGLGHRMEGNPRGRRARVHDGPDFQHPGRIRGSGRHPSRHLRQEFQWRSSRTAADRSTTRPSRRRRSGTT